MSRLKLFLSVSLLTGISACSQAPSNVGAAYPGNVPLPSSSANLQPSASATPEALPQPTAAPTASASSAPSAEPDSPVPQPQETPKSTENDIYDYRENFFKNYGINPFVEAETDPLSTFALDVDTASYSITRSYLNSNQLPPPAAVRTEEYLNYFDYHYPQPINGKFAIYTDFVPSYFSDPASNTKLLRIGLQAQEVLARNRKPAVLTLVIDASGSMNRDNRLELVKQSLKLLLDQLNVQDQVGIVVYGTSAQLVLPHTSLANKTQIVAALNNLRPEGSTNAEAGLNLGYSEASAHFEPGAINRVILCSDGVANVGARGPEALLENVKGSASKGISLTTLGFGLGQYNDALMEQLANQGDGNYAYIDSLDEAQKVLSEQLTSTLQTLAKDAKLQVVFDPGLVSQYRLLGYENRDLADEDFLNDAVDAGEVGSNHSVTALYEVRFKDSFEAGAFAKIQLRYRDLDDNQIKEQSKSVLSTELSAFSQASPSLRLAVSVAQMAEILRDSVFANGNPLSEVVELAKTAQEGYPDDFRIAEFVTLAQKAAGLKQVSSVQSVESLVAKSQNPQQLPAWNSFLLRQLAGKSSQ